MFMKLSTKNHNSFSAGFSLLEVLIASVVGLLLIGVVVQNYLSAKNIYNVETEMTRLSENIRFANFILQQNIMHAGFAGCRKIIELNLVNHTNMNFSASDVIYGYESGQVPNYLSRKVAPGADVIVITKANADITELVADVQSEATVIKVKQNPATEGNRFLLISDCVNAELLVAKNWLGNAVTIEKQLNNSYQTKNTRVSRFEELTFFISKTRRVTAKNQPIYSLYSMINRGKKQELIPDISNMQIVYRVNKQYLKAGEITNQKLWDQVLSVVITLEPQNQLLALKPWKIHIRLRERN
jgi:Tfp pilus assembly protein PilW